MWRDSFPLAEGGTAILLHRFHRRFAHPTQQPYRAFFQATTRLGREPVELIEAELVAVADPRVIDTIEVGFVGGQVNPILFVQDQPLYGNNFTNDVITYKVRHEYGGAVVDYRGFYQGNN